MIFTLFVIVRQKCENNYIKRRWDVGKIERI